MRLLGYLRLLCAIAATLATAWLIISLSTAPVRNAPLPTPPCGPKPTLLGSNSGYEIYLSVHGCETVSVSAEATLAESLPQIEASLVALGLPTPPKPIRVAIYPIYSAPYATFIGPNGGAGALVLRNIDSSTLTRALANLALSYAAPGLPASARSSLAEAFAVYTPSGGLNAAPPGSQGAYAAWLVARFGPDPVRQALIHCEITCSWPRVLDAALRASGHNPSVLAAQFASTP